MDPIRVAVFGNGFARTVVLPALRHVEGVRVEGLASPNLERLRATAAEFGISRIAADHREILDSVRPDLVFIVTPPHRHAEMAIRSLEAGCHVVCEKPMALNAGETERMVAAARAHPNNLALIDHELRFLPGRMALKDLIVRGELGRALHADYTLHSPGRRDPAQPWNWWSDRESGGGTLGALGSHALDALRVWLGEVVEVRGFLETAVKERRDPSTGLLRSVTADDLAAAWLRYESGASATLTLSLVAPERVHRISLAGTEGTAVIDEQGPLRVGRAMGAPVARVLEDDLPASSALGIPDTDWARAFLRSAQRLAEAIRLGRQLEGAATFEDGHRVQQVLDAIRRSANSARWVRVGSRP